MNLEKYKETNGKQQSYTFRVQNIENRFFNKNIQYSSTFDRYWFGSDVVTNSDEIPSYVDGYIRKLNQNSMSSTQYLKKLTSDFSKWNLLKNMTKNDESKHHADKEEKLLFDDSKNHSMIFRCGGVYASNKQRCAECDVTIFNHLRDDKDVITAYALSLPSLSVPTSLTSSVYNQFNGILYCIGGETDQQQVTPNIFSLNLNQQINERNGLLEWKTDSVQLYESRKSASLCLVDRDDLMIIGGKSRSGEKLQSVELYVNGYKATKLLAPLNLPRSASGCLLFDESDKRVIVGGGWGGWNNDETQKSIEWYDAIKNEWYLFPKRTNFEHQFQPILWNDAGGQNGGNPNVIYIAGDCIGIDSKSMLGTVEWIDIRENTNGDDKWNIFQDEKSLVQMFSLQKVDEKMWRSRSLMIA